MMLLFTWASAQSGQDLLAVEESWNRSLENQDLATLRSIALPPGRGPFTVDRIVDGASRDGVFAARLFGTSECQALAWSRDGSSGSLWFRCPSGERRIQYRLTDDGWKRGGPTSMSVGRKASFSMDPLPWTLVRMEGDVAFAVSPSFPRVEMRLLEPDTCDGRRSTGQRGAVQRYAEISKERQVVGWGGTCRAAELVPMADNHPCEPCQALLAEHWSMLAERLAVLRPYDAGGFARLAEEASGEPHPLSKVGTKEAGEGAVRDRKGRVLFEVPKGMTAFERVQIREHSVWSGD